MLQRLYGLPTLLLTLTALFWAGNAVAGRVAVGEVRPFSLVFFRWTIVALLLWPFYGREIARHWPSVRPRLPSLIINGAVGFTAFNALYYVAAHYTSAVNLGILQGSMPIFMLVGAFLAYGTRATWLQILGVLITMAGVIVVATRGMPLKLLELDYNRGDLIMMLACACYAFYGVALRRRPAVPGIVYFVLLATVASIVSIPLFLYEMAQPDFTWPTGNGLLITAYVAVFPSCLAQIFFLRGVDLIGPGRAGVFINLVPVFTALLAVVLISEPFAVYHAAALALVVAGVWISEQLAEAASRRRAKALAAAHRAGDAD